MEKLNTTDLTILLASTYMPSQDEAQLIIQNVHTLIYRIKNDNCTFNATKVVYKSFEDFLMTIQKPDITNNYYKNGLLTKFDQFELTKLIRTKEFIRNNDGLLLKAIGTMNVEIIDVETIHKTEYRYTPNQIFEIEFENNTITHYNTHFLNEKKQCYRLVSQFATHAIRLDRLFTFDDYGRVITERYDNTEIIYTYDTKFDKNHSSITGFDLETNKVQFSTIISIEGNTSTRITKNADNEIMHKMIIISERNCDSKSYIYNDKNELIHVSSCASEL